VFFAICGCNADMDEDIPKNC